jgi:nucleotide-binding universal stress UspA family protein
MSPTTILVPTDFSDASVEAKAYAVMLAKALGASLHLLHVIGDPVKLGWGIEQAYLPQMLERIEGETRKQLEALASAEDRKAFKVHCTVEVGSPAETILTYAETHGVDLIVMGTHGRGTVERLWLGSVTERVLQHAKCPVVSVRPLRS